MNTKIIKILVPQLITLVCLIVLVVQIMAQKKEIEALKKENIELKEIIKKITVPSDEIFSSGGNDSVRKFYGIK